MAYSYNDITSRKLGFRSDEDERTKLDDIQHALEVLTEANERCMNTDMRTSEVYAALEYLSSLASRRAALIAFRNALDWQHPDQRAAQVSAALKSIRAALAS